MSKSMSMTDFIATNPLPISLPQPPSPRLHFPNSTYQLKANSHAPFSAKLSKAINKSVSAALSSSSSSNGSSPMSGPSTSKGSSFYNQLQFQDRKAKTFGLDRNHNHNHVDGLEDSPNETGSDSVGLDEGSRKSQEEDLVRIQQGDDDLKKDEKFSGKVGFTRVKQIIRRSNLLAKQVITIRSALSLGFVSQLWVDTTSWMVLFVEVRPNLLSGDSEKFLLEDITQVGDVVLVQDGSVIENEFKMIGLETLVGYKVVTPSHRNIGKVRGYTFSINSGAVEELELDSFGLSIIPSSLVSTYSLLVEDVLEVVSDAVVVHEAAASRIQRLSKGFLGNQNVGTSVDDFEDYDSEQSVTYGHVSRRKKSFGRKKANRRDWDNEDYWELPMDYL